MTTYVKRLNRHLTAYKTSRLGISEKGAFNYRERTVFHGHILPGHQSKWLNILEPIRSDVQKFVSHERILSSRVHIVAIEDVLHHLLKDKSLDPQLSIYAELLADKYLPV